LIYASPRHFLLKEQYFSLLFLNIKYKPLLNWMAADELLLYLRLRLREVLSSRPRPTGVPHLCPSGYIYIYLRFLYLYIYISQAPVSGGGVWMPSSRFNHGNCTACTSHCSRFNLLSHYFWPMLSSFHIFLSHLFIFYLVYPVY
jgi:hypothetical protein